MNDRFRDRSEAGQLLAARLNAYAGRADVIVLAALPIFPKAKEKNCLRWCARAGAPGELEGYR